MLSLEITHKMVYDIAVNDTEIDSSTRLQAISLIKDIVVQKVELLLAHLLSRSLQNQ